jgi:GT2 family glycosyltransferase/glycosyltransferase involved in cell wall biosynthesis
MRLIRPLLRPLWHRRHHIIRNTRNFFNWVFVTLDALPFPKRAKLMMQDMLYLLILHLVVHTERFQRWSGQHQGTSRLQYLLQPEAHGAKIYAALPTAPTIEQWQEVKASLPVAHSATLDVIIPVYSGFDQSLNSIYAALHTRPANSTPYNIIVIDDCSPDKALSAALRQLAKDGLITLHVNRENLGFVQTVNKGMMLNPAHDIILLNADTEVYHDWVDRMVAAAAADSTIATVTPLSNNAEICSYPYFVQNNEAPLELSFEALDALAAEANAGAIVDVPTGVGFCMYISRACLRDVGLFDVEHFGKGYGEENDFCVRASNRGWRNVVACDTYVRHVGGTSFGKSKSKRCQKACDVLCSLHPHYPHLVRAFIADDPLRLHRQAIDVARISMANKAQKTILMVNHHVGGGTERHVRELCEGLQQQGVGYIVMEPAPLGGGMVRLRHYHATLTPNLVFSMEYDRDALFACLRGLGVFHVHVHHLVHYPARIQHLIAAITHTLDCHYDVTLHDYYTICPRINLIDHENYYCGEPAVQGCETCIQKNHSHAHGMMVWEWRMAHAAFLAAARRVYVPNADMSARMVRYFPEQTYTLRPHAETFDTHPAIEVAMQEGQRLRVGIVGAISGFKGSKLLAQLVEDANARSLAIEYSVIGYTDRSDLHENLERLHITGKYEEAEIGSLLQQQQPHVILIPSIWPETYCYTLSIAWRFGIMPVVFDIGAPAQRARAIGKDAARIVPLSYAKQPALLNDWLIAQFYGKKIPAPTRPANVGYAALLTDYYELDTLPAAHKKPGKQSQKPVQEPLATPA